MTELEQRVQRLEREWLTLKRELSAEKFRPTPKPTYTGTRAVRGEDCQCGGPARVVDSRPVPRGRRRRFQCLACERRWAVVSPE